MTESFRAERAVSPLDGSELWVVLDPGLVMHRQASDFLRALHGASRSLIRSVLYAGRVARFLAGAPSRESSGPRSVWRSLARFKHFMEVTPYRNGRLRSGATVNATLTAVCEFLRFCARTGVIEQAVADRLSEPRWLRFTPAGFDAGESGQFRTVRARMLKARAQTPFPEALTAEQAERVMACCRRPRERFMAILLQETWAADRRGAGTAPGATCTCCRTRASWDARCWALTSMFATEPIPMGRWRSRGFLGPCRRARPCRRLTRTTSLNAAKSSVRTIATWCSSTSTTSRWVRR